MSAHIPPDLKHIIGSSPESAPNRGRAPFPEDGGGRPLIYVVDDEPHICQILSQLLSKAGYEVVAASDGDEALERLQREPPDVILSDLMMPRLDGIGLLRRAKEIDDTIGFVLLTGAGTLENAVRALQLQADDYLLKPFNLDEVLLSVERALDRRRLVRENRYYQKHLEQRVSQQADQLDRMFIEALLTLANAIEARDGDTGDHVERVTRYAVCMGRELEMEVEDLRNLWIAALLHDIGKIGIPDHILTKPAALDDQEREVIRKHPEIGAAILRRSTFLCPALPGVLHHQERWDGTGYPSGLAGEEISLQGRILAVADAYDAMICDRPYRAGCAEHLAVRELEDCAGSHFDPSVVDAFVRAREKSFALDWTLPRFPHAGLSPDGAAAIARVFPNGHTPAVAASGASG